MRKPTMHTFHWSGHSASLLRGIKELYDSCENVDCVLECDGGLLRGHRVVLAASSGYLRNLFKEHENTLYVPLKEVKFRSMQKIFHFVYNGSVNVPTIQVPDVMKTANLLEITPLQMCFFSVFLGNPSKKNCVEPLENLHSDDRVSTDNELHISKCISWSKNKRIVGVRRDEKNIDELEVCDEGMDRVLDLNVVKDEVNRAETEGEQGGASLPDTFLEVTLPCVKKEEVWEEGGNGDVSCSDPLGQVSSQEKPSDGESWKSEQKPCCAFEMKTETEKEDKEEVQCLFEKSDRERRERAERRSEVIQVKKEENEGPMEKSEQHNGCIRLKTKSENVFHLKEARVVLERISSATINNLGATMVNSSVAVDSSTRRLVSEGPPSLEERRNNCHEEKSLNCSHCVAVFISNKEYKNHLYSHLEKEQYLCHICGLQYGSRVKLVVHLRFHKRGKKFSCTQCSVTCSSKASLLQHLRTHSREKPFVCATCSCAFAQLGTLKQHMRIHTGVKPFACSVCDATFAHAGDRNRHLHAHWGKPRIPCRECPLTFYSKGDLNKHMLIHSGEKPYVCNHCLLGFNRKSILKKHIIRFHIP